MKSKQFVHLMDWIVAFFSFHMLFSTKRTYVPQVDEEEEASWQPEFDFLHSIGQRFSVSVPFIAQTAMQKVLQKSESCTPPGNYKINNLNNSILLPPKHCEKCKCVQVLGLNTIITCGKYDKKVLKDLKHQKGQNCLSTSGKKKLSKITQRRNQVFIKCKLCKYSQLQNSLLLKRRVYKKVHVKGVKQSKINAAKISWVENDEDTAAPAHLKKNTRNILNLDNRRSKHQQHWQKTAFTSLKRPELSLKNLFAS